MSVPGAPNIYVRPASSPNQLEFWWNEPSNIELPITYYKLACSSIGYTSILSPQARETIVNPLSTNINYTFTLLAANANGEGTVAVFRTVETGVKSVGALVTNLVATSTSAGAVTVSWYFSQKAGEANVNWYLFEAIPSTPTSSTVRRTLPSSVTTFDVTTIPVDVYNFRVRAVNDAGWQASNINYITATNNYVVPAGIPTQPTNITVLSNSLTQITIGWSGGVNATGYTFTLNASPFIPLFINVLNSSAAFSNLSSGTTYSVAVTAINSLSSIESVYQSISTNIFRPVTNLQMAYITTNSFFASWNASNFATSYSYSLINQATSTSIIVNNFANVYATLTNLNSNTTYAFSVVAYSNNLSTVATSISSITLPDTPTISYNTVTTSSFKVSWSSPNSVSSFYYTDINGSTTTTLKSSITVSSLNSGTVYTVGAAAYNTSGSSLANAVTVLTAPTNPSITTLNITANSFTINYSSYGANSYLFNINGVIANTYNTSQTITGLSSGTSYSGTVIAINATASSQSTVFNTLTVPNQPSVTTNAIGTSSISIQFSSFGASIYLYRLGSVSSYTNSQTATILSLSSGTSHIIHVAAINSSGSSIESVISTITIPASPSVSTYTVVDTYAILQYSSFGASSYFLNINNSSTITASQSTLITSLSAATSYTGEVIAINSSGSSLSTVFTLLTLPLSPSISTLALGTSSLTIGFYSQGASSYYYSVGGINNYTAQSSATISSLSSGTTYTATVLAINQTGSSYPTQVIELMLPAAPSLTLTNLTPSSFTLQYSSFGASSYLYNINGVSSYTTSQILTISSLVPGVLVTGAIYAINSSGSSVSTYFSEQSAPLAPTQQVTAITTASFTVNYQSQGASSYYYNIANTSATTQSTGVSLTNLSSGTVYSGVLVASNTSGSSLATVFSTITVSNQPSVTKNNISTTSFNLNFSSVGASSYYYQINEQSSYTQSNTAVITSLAAGNLYAGFVIAINQSGLSNGTNFIVLMLPASPSVRENNVTTSSFTMQFSTVGASSYYYNIANKSSYTTSQAVTISSLSSGTSYTGYVIAINSSGTSQSTIFSTITLAQAPQVSTTNITTSLVTFQYSSFGASSYYYSLANQSSNTTSQSTTISSLSSGTAYVGILVAINNSGSSLSTVFNELTLPANPSLVISNLSTTAFQMSFSTVGGSSYTYSISTIANSVSTNATSVTISSLSSGTYYPISIFATNMTGQSQTTSTTILTVPVAATATAAKNPLIYTPLKQILSWTDNQQISSFTYTIYNNNYVLATNSYNITPVFFSSDCVNWYESYFNVGSIPHIQCLSYTGYTSDTGAMWIAGTSELVSTSKMIMYSFDGWTWLNATVNNTYYNLSTSKYTTIAAASNGYISLMSSDIIGLLYSTDGINWSQTNYVTTAGTNDVLSISWNGTYWLAGTTTEGIIRSGDGIDWSAATSTNNNITSLLWFNSLWIAASSKLIYSNNSNGSAWLSTGTSNIIFPSPQTYGNNYSSMAIACNANIAVACAQGLAYSTDGMTWSTSSSYNSLYPSTFATSIVWNGTAFVVATLKRTNTVCNSAYSYDGINWLSGNITGLNVMATNTVLPTVAQPGTGLLLTSTIVAQTKPNYSTLVTITGGDMIGISGTNASGQSSDNIYPFNSTTYYNTFSTFSNVILFQSLTVPSPITTTTSSVTQTSFIVNWSPVYNASSYSYTFGANTYSLSKNISTAQIIRLSSGIYYSVIVTAINQLGVSQTTVSQQTNLANPTVSISQINANSFTFEYSSVGASSYFYNVVDNSTVTANTTTTITSLSSATVYSGYVVAIVPTYSSQSTIFSTLTLSQAPSVTVTGATGTSVTFQFSSFGATSYFYNFANQTNTTASTFATVASLLGNSTYTGYVTAINASGSSLETAFTGQTIGNLSSMILTISNETQNSFTASWTGAASSYTIIANNHAIVSTGKTATFAGLVSGSTYSVIVAGISPGAISFASTYATTINTAIFLVAVTAITSSDFTTSWFSDGNNSSYSYLLTNATTRSSISTQSSQIIDYGLTNQTVIFTDLLLASVYNLKIIAYNDNNQPAIVNLLVSTLATETEFISFATYPSLSGIASDPSTGNIYLSDPEENQIVQITPGGITYVYAGTGAFSTIDGTATVAAIANPKFLNIHNNNLYVVQDISGSEIASVRQISLSNQYVSTFITSYINSFSNYVQTDISGYLIQKISDNELFSRLDVYSQTGQRIYEYLLPSNYNSLCSDSSNNIYTFDIVTFSIVKINNLSTIQYYPIAAAFFPTDQTLWISGLMTSLDGSTIYALTNQGSPGNPANPALLAMDVTTGLFFTIIAANPIINFGSYAVASLGSSVQGMCLGQAGRYIFITLANTEVARITLPKSKPTQPTSLVASAITSTGFTVTWSIVGGAAAVATTAYVYSLNGIQVTAVASAITDNGLTGSNVIFKDLSGNTNYTVIILATNAAGGTSNTIVVNTATTTQQVKTFATIPNNGGPTQCAFNSAGSALYVTQYNTNQVHAISYPYGNILDYTLSSIAAIDTSTIGLCIDAVGNVFVQSGASYNIYRFNTYGNLSIFGSGSTGAITIGHDGYMYTSYNALLNRTDKNGINTNITLTITDGSTGVSGYNGICVGPNGYLYATESNRILKIALPTAPLVAATAVTIAGSPSGASGFVNSSGSNARFNTPKGISIDAIGDIYVADLNNQRIRKVTSLGVVTTVTGNGTAGSVNGLLASAQLNLPYDVTIGPNGNLFATSYGDNTIREIQMTPLVTRQSTYTFLPVIPYPSFSTINLSQSSLTISLAQESEATYYTYNLSSITTGVISSNQLNQTTINLSSLSVNTAYKLTVTANDGSLIVTSTVSVITTLFYGPSTPTNLLAYNINPSSFTLSWTQVENATNLPSSYRYTINSTVTVPQYDFGVSNQDAIFNNLQGLSSYYVTVTAINNGGSTTSALFSTYTTGESTMILTNNNQPNPRILAFTQDSNTGTMYYIDMFDYLIYSISPVTGIATYLSGSGNYGYADGAPSQASFANYDLCSMYIYNGLLYMADTFNFRIRTVNLSTGYVSTIAGNGLSTVVDNSNGLLASFAGPRYITVNNKGLFFIVDNDIRNMTTTGAVTTYDNNKFEISTIYNYSTYLNTGGIDSNNILYLNPPTNYPISTLYKIVSPGSLTSSYNYNIQMSFGMNISKDNSKINIANTFYSSEFLTINPYSNSFSIYSTKYKSQPQPANPLRKYSTFFYNTSGISLSPDQITFCIPLYGRTGTTFGISIETQYIHLLRPNAGPSPITSTQATNVSQSSFTLSWQGGLGTNSYSYFWNGNSITPSVDNGIYGQNATFTGLTINSTLTNYVVVEAMNLNGDYTAITPYFLSLAQPTIIQSNVTALSFTINWYSPLATSYLYTNIYGLTSTTFNYTDTISSLSTQTMYSSVVVAYNTDTSTNMVSSLTTVTLINTLLPLSSSISTSQITTSSFTFQYSTIGASSYYYNIAGYSSNTANQSTTISSLYGGSTYSGFIVAINTNVSSLSTIFSTLTLPVAPTVSTSMISTTAFTFQYSSFGASSYYYNVADYSSNTASQSTTITSLIPGSTYSGFVVAINTSGSTMATIFSTITVTEAPTVSTSMISTTSFTFQYSSFGASSYYYNVAGYSSNTENQSTTISSLYGGSTYSGFIIAINKSGSSLSTIFSTATVTAAPTVSTSMISTTSFTFQYSSFGASSYYYNVADYSSNTASQSTTITSLIPGSTYSGFVIAINTSGSSLSTIFSTVTILAAPTESTSMISTTSFTFQYSTVGASSYYYNVAGYSSNTENQSTTISSLYGGSTYSGFIVAINTTVSSLSTIFSTVTVTEAPTVSTSMINTTAFTFQYSSFGASSYYYNVADYSSNTANQSTMISTLYGGSTYSGFVIAINTSGSSLSTIFSTLTVPAAPTVSTSMISTTAFTFQYSSFGASSYYYNVAGYSSNTANQSTMISTLTSGSTYSGFVVAINTSGSSLSTIFSTVIVSLGPAAPTVSTSMISTTSFTFQYSSIGASSYYYNVAGRSTNTAFKATTLSFLTSCSTYSGFVIAINTNGSSLSTIFSTLTLPVAPTVSTSMISTTSFTFQYSTVGASSYYYNVAGYSAYTANQSTTISSVTSLTVFTGFVVAINTSGSSFATIFSTFTLPSAVPEAPKVSTSLITESSFTFQYSSFGASSYYYNIAGISSYTASKATTISSLTAFSTYTGFVLAINTIGPSLSTIFSAVPLPTIPYSTFYLTTTVFWVDMLFDSNGQNLYGLNLSNALRYLVHRVTYPGMILSTYVNLDGVQGHGFCQDLSGNLYTGGWNFDNNVSIDLLKIPSAGNYNTISSISYRPYGFTIGQDGYVYMVTTSFNILKMNNRGVITLIVPTFTDGSTNSNIEINSIRMGPDGYLYINDAYLSRIIKMSTTGNAITFAGRPSSVPPGVIRDGTGTNALFFQCGYIVMDATGNMYVQDQGCIRKITPTGVVTTIGRYTAECYYFTPMCIGPDGNLWAIDIYGTINVLQMSLPPLQPQPAYGFTNAATDVPNQVTGVTTSAITPSGFTINWSNGNPATGVTITLNGSTVVPNLLYMGGKKAIFTGLSAGTIYTVIVTATNGAGSGTASASVYVALIWQATSITGLQLWFDGGDSTSIIMDEDFYISTWNDKSGLNNNTTAVTGSPTYTEGTGVVFDGESYFALPNGSIPYGNSSYSIYIVANWETANYYTVISGGNNALEHANIGIAEYGSGQIVTWWNNDDITTSSTITPGTKTLYDSLYQSNGRRNVFLYGTNVGSNDPASPRIQPNTSNYIGVLTNGSSWKMAGSIQEILVYNTNHTQVQRQVVEGYLAWKWGVQTQLPSNHPFYNSPPAVNQPIT